MMPLLALLPVSSNTNLLLLMSLHSSCTLTSFPAHARFAVRPMMMMIAQANTRAITSNNYFGCQLAYIGTFHFPRHPECCICSSDGSDLYWRELYCQSIVHIQAAMTRKYSVSQR